MHAPYIRGKRYIDWDLPDPKGQPLEAVRALRDDIKARVESLAADSRLPARIRSNGLSSGAWPNAGPQSSLMRMNSGRMRLQAVIVTTVPLFSWGIEGNCGVASHS